MFLTRELPAILNQTCKMPSEVPENCCTSFSHQKESHSRSFWSRRSESDGESLPTTCRIRAASMVAICPLIPLGTFNPAFPQSSKTRSVCNRRDVTGTTNTSPSNVPAPMIIAGLTFWLLRSVKGIGNRMTSFREKCIVYVVLVVLPNFQQCYFALSVPIRFF